MTGGYDESIFMLQQNMNINMGYGRKVFARWRVCVWIYKQVAKLFSINVGRELSTELVPEHLDTYLSVDDGEDDVSGLRNVEEVPSPLPICTLGRRSLIETFNS